MIKKTILVDLDGVLNQYSGKYDKNFIEPIANEAYNFVKELSKEYKIVIFTTRNLLLTSKWLIDNKLDYFIEDVTNIKIPAYIIIDDRCINFNGNFSQLKQKIDKFEVWYKN